MKRLFSLIMCAYLLTGCNGDGGNDNDTQVGYLTFHGIRGLSYETQSQSGITGNRGEFRYYPGETITFRLGSIVLARDVPAKERLSPLDLEPAHEAELYHGVMVNGLSTHKPVESELVRADHNLINIYRLLLSIDIDDDEKTGIYIRDETLDEIAAYPIEEPINFNKQPSDFGNSSVITAPENLFVWALCFRYGRDRQCTDPYDGRNIKSENIAISYMQDQLDIISDAMNANFYLSPYTFEIAPDDRSLKTVSVLSHRNKWKVGELEAITSDESVVAIHNIDTANQQVTFYNVSSETVAEATLTLNIRVEGDYRWHQKPLKVRIHPNPAKR